MNDRSGANTAIAFAIAMTSVMSGCDLVTVSPELVGSIEGLLISDDFDYSTTQAVEVSLRALTNAGEPISGVTFEVSAPDADSSAGVIFRGSTDTEGWVRTTVSVPVFVSSHLVTTDYIGLINQATLEIQSGRASYVFGGTAPGNGAAYASMSVSPPDGAVAWIDGPSY